MPVKLTVKDGRHKQAPCRLTIAGSHDELPLPDSVGEHVPWPSATQALHSLGMSWMSINPSRYKLIRELFSVRVGKQRNEHEETQEGCDAGQMVTA